MDTPERRLESLARHYDRDIRQNTLRIPCPAHGGDHDNCALWPDPAKMRIGAVCYSEKCHYDTIADAVLAQTNVSLRSGLWNHRVNRKFAYADGRTVYRQDLHNGDYVSKRIRQDVGATPDNAPLYVCKPDGAPMHPAVIMVEGEGVAERLASLGYWAATWRGGAHSAGKANYSGIAGRSVILWPDDNLAGHDGMRATSDAIGEAQIAVAVLWAVPQDYTGDTGLDPDDYPPDAIGDILAAAVYSPPRFGAEPKPRAALVMINPYSLLALPDPQWLLPDILPMTGLTLLHGAPKSGKSTFVGGIIKAVSLGTWFLNPAWGDLPQLYSWLFTEMSPLALKMQMRHLDDVTDTGMRKAMLKGQQPQFGGYDAFAEVVYQAYYQAWQEGQSPGIIVYDTLSDWWGAEHDSNDYHAVLRAVEPLRQLADQLEGCASIAIHHSSKSGRSSNVGRVLGSQMLAGKADMVIGYSAMDSNPMNREILIDGRFSAPDAPNRYFCQLQMPGGIFGIAGDGETNDEITDAVLIAIQSGAVRHGEILEHLKAEQGILITRSKLSRVLTTMRDKAVIQGEGPASRKVYSIP